MITGVSSPSKTFEKRNSRAAMAIVDFGKFLVFEDETETRESRVVSYVHSVPELQCRTNVASPGYLWRLVPRMKNIFLRASHGRHPSFSNTTNRLSIDRAAFGRFQDALRRFQDFSGIFQGFSRRNHVDMYQPAGAHLVCSKEHIAVFHRDNLTMALL